MTKEKEQFKKIVEEEFNELSEIKKQNILKNGFTIDKILSDFSIDTISWDYLAFYNDFKSEVVGEKEEYREELKEVSKTQYDTILKAYNELSEEEKKIINKSKHTFSYLADIYTFDNPNNTEEAKLLLIEEIHDYIDRNKPYYYLSKDELKEILIKQLINPLKAKMLDDDEVKGILSDINDYHIDKTTPLNYEEIDNKIKEEEGLNYKYLLFCEEYIKRNGNIKATCEYIGIGRATAYRWLELDEVKEYLLKREEEITKETDKTFKNTFNECFKELNKLITKPLLNGSDRIKAIDTFLKHYENIERLKQPLTQYDE